MKNIIPKTFDEDLNDLDAVLNKMGEVENRLKEAGDANWPDDVGWNKLFNKSRSMMRNMVINHKK